MKPHIGVNTFDLAEHDGDDLFRLTQALVADLQHYSNMNMDDEHDQTQIAFDELLEYICFDRDNKPPSPYQKVMQKLEQEAQQ